MIREKGKEHSSGKTAEYMKENGKMESNMESVYLLQKITKLKKVNGQMERRFDG